MKDCFDCPQFEKNYCKKLKHRINSGEAMRCHMMSCGEFTFEVNMNKKKIRFGEFGERDG